MESRFVGKDGFIHAIAICKQRVIDCSADDIMEILLKETPTTETSNEKLENGDLIKLKPEMPLEVKFTSFSFRRDSRAKFYFISGAKVERIKRDLERTVEKDLSSYQSF